MQNTVHGLCPLQLHQGPRCNILILFLFIDALKQKRHPPSQIDSEKGVPLWTAKICKESRCRAYVDYGVLFCVCTAKHPDCHFVSVPDQSFVALYASIIELNRSSRESPFISAPRVILSRSQPAAKCLSLNFFFTDLRFRSCAE